MWAYVVTTLLVSSLYTVYSHSLLDAPVMKKRAVDLPCSMNGETYESGTTFSLSGYSKCFVYSCNDGSVTLVQAGCQDSAGNCHDVGETWSVGCFTYQCNKGELLDGKTYYSTDFVSGGCKDSSGTCHEVGDSWTTSSCYTYTCSKEVTDGKTYYKTSVESAQCKDADGVCRTEDEIFPYVVNGKRYTTCKCTIDGSTRSYKCSG